MLVVYGLVFIRININMRCIEMWMRDPYVVCVNGLTLT